MSTLSKAEYVWKQVSGGIGLHPGELRGNKADYIIIDDPLNTEINMTATEQSLRGIGTAGSAFWLNEVGGASKPKKKDYNTVGVRFLRGHNLAKLYTYRVKKGVKLHLGQEVVVPTDPDKQGYNTNTIAVVVRIDPKPQDNGHWDYKTIVGTVKPI